MPLSPQFYEQTLARFQQVRPVTAKKMFGGASLYVGEVAFAILDDDLIFFKTDDANRPDFEAHGMGPWHVMPNSEKYRELPAHVLESDDVLAEWVDRACEASARISAAKKPKRKS
ncbi:MAG: TfoX/Sxy family protein [Armatimonadetes bacterium]|nr:TfoX/Sxy family protein [Armatimonadota bacterium]